jgi:hypothetical protein
MSEYVAARYAKSVLQEARSAEPDVATKLINDLLRDLSSLQGSSDASAQTFTAIRSLSLSHDHPRSLRLREWNAATQAAEAWCQSAFK